MFHQQLRDRGMLLRHSPHERAGPAPGFLRIHLGAPIQQYANGIELAGAGCHHQRGVAGLGQRSVGIGSSGDQAIDHARASVDGGCQKRGCIRDVRGRDLRSRFNQEIRQLQIVRLSGPVQRRRTVDLRGVHIGVPFEQGAHGRPYPRAAPHPPLRS